MRGTEFSWFGSYGSPRLEKPTMTVELSYAGNGGEISIGALTTMTVTDVDTTIGPVNDFIG